MIEEWRLCKLGEILDLQNGFAFKSREYSAQGHFLIRIGNVQDGFVDLSNPKYVALTSTYLKKFELHEGDILISLTGYIGRVGVIQAAQCPAALNQRVARISLKDSTRVDRSFLLHFLQSSYFKEELNNAGRGAAQQNVSISDIAKIEIPLPPLPEQRRLVSILDEAFAAIHKAKANTEKNFQNAKELFESYLQEVFESKGEDWEEMTLGEVLQKTETVDPTKSPNKEFIYLDVSSVNKDTLEIEGPVVLKGKDAPSRARKLLRTNDIIFATVRPTLRRVAIISEEYDCQVGSTGYFVLRPTSMLNSKLIFYFLLTKSFNDQMEKLQRGASYPAVTDSDVRSQLIRFPKSLDEQEFLVEKLDAIFTESKRLGELCVIKVTAFEELKKSILQKAFNGELETRKTLA